MLKYFMYLLGISMETKTLDDLRSPEWQSWLESNSTFRYQPTGNYHPFSARKEIPKKSKVSYWYAYRKIDNKQYKKYIGKTHDLTHSRLEEIAKELDLAPRLETANIQPKSTLQSLRIEIEQLRSQVAKIPQLEIAIEQLQLEVDTLRAYRQKTLSHEK
jgi:hypothetical protein